MALFDFNITTCKTTQKWQKEGHFTTPVPVDPKLFSKAGSGWAIRELVPKAVYTDREENLKYLYKAAICHRICRETLYYTMYYSFQY